jgi:hypothetical protein
MSTLFPLAETPIAMPSGVSASANFAGQNWIMPEMQGIFGQGQNFPSENFGFIPPQRRPFAGFHGINKAKRKPDKVPAFSQAKTKLA